MYIDSASHETTEPACPQIEGQAAVVDRVLAGDIETGGNPKMWYYRTCLNADGFDRHGYDRYWQHRTGYGSGFDLHGFDRDGFDTEGYSRSGFNGKGTDRWGNTVEGHWMAKNFHVALLSETQELLTTADKENGTLHDTDATNDNNPFGHNDIPDGNVVPDDSDVAKSEDVPCNDNIIEDDKTSNGDNDTNRDALENNNVEDDHEPSAGDCDICRGRKTGKAASTMRSLSLWSLHNQNHRD